MKDECVYVIGTPGSTTVKIGRTTDLPQRVAAIQRMSPVPLEVLWTHPGGHELETNLHRHFSSIRSHGEWFCFEADPVELVRFAVENQPWATPKLPTQRKRSRAPISRNKPDRRPVSLNVYGPLDERTTRIASAIKVVQAEVRAVDDLAERYHSAREYRHQIDDWQRALMAMQQSAALQLKDGRSWREVGELLGITGSRAEQIAKGAQNAE